MTTESFIENLSGSNASHNEGERPAAFPGEAAEQFRGDRLPHLAQAETQQDGQALNAAAATQPGVQTVEAEGNVVKLPAGTSIEKVEIDGENLVLVQPDGSRVVIENAALHVPTFVIDDVEIPKEALVAALEASNINVAAGPDGTLTASAAGNPSAGGNFAEAIPGIGDAGPAIDLLDPTALQFGTLDEEILLPAFANRGPSIGFGGGSSGSVGGITFANHVVDEAYLPNGSRGGNGFVRPFALSDEPSQEEGSDPSMATGAFTVSDPDGLGDIASITISVGGTSGTYTLGQLAGLEIHGEYGDLTILSFNAATGEATYTYKLREPFDSDGPDGTQGEDLQGRNLENDRDVFTLTVTDRGGLSASGELRIDIVDDVPQAPMAELESFTALKVDETNLGQDSSSSDPSFNASDLFPEANLVFGADGKGSVGYTLLLSGAPDSNSIGSGLYAHGTGGAAGAEILLTQNGDTITGAVGDKIYFTITLDDKGNVTLHQENAIYHPVKGSSENTSDYNDLVSLLVSKGASLKLVVTITDGDGDIAKGGIELGNGEFFSFADDGPSIKIDAVKDEQIKVVTQDAETIGDSTFDTATDKVEGARTFEQAFREAVTATYGKDGQGSVAVKGYELSLENASSDGKVDSGLTFKGKPITLTLVNGDVVGSVTGVAEPIFRIHVDKNSGEVKLTQYQQIDHASGSDHIDLPDGKVTLSATATVTDRDGDTAEGKVQVDLGGNIGFDDAGPQVSIIQDTNFSITHDETFGLDSWPFGDADDILRFGVESLFNGVANPGHDPDTLGFPIGYARSSGPVFSVDADYGADGAAASGAKVFSLTLTTSTDAPAASIDSGLKTTDGYSIFLYQEGGLIVGRYEDGGQGADPAAFAICIDPATGVVTMVQYVSLAHGNVNSSDESISLENALGKVQATVTIKDGDGDTDTASVDIGGSIRFEDDGPHAFDTVGQPNHKTDSLDDESLSGGLAGGPGDASGSNSSKLSGGLPFISGVDGLKGLSVSAAPGDLKVSNDKGQNVALEAIWVDAQGVGHPRAVSVEWVGNSNGIGGVLEGTATDPGGVEFKVFTLTVNANGAYTLEMHAPLAHPLTDNPSSSNVETSWEDGLKLEFTYTVTDGDNDTDSAKLIVKVDDDSPVFINGGVEDSRVDAAGQATGDLNIAFGADGRNADSGLKITGIPTIAGVKTELSTDGKTLTATVEATGKALYTLTLHDNGTYTFEQAGSLAGPDGTLKDTSVKGGFGPTQEKDFNGFTLQGISGNLNGSGQGIGIGDNGMDHGDEFAVIFKQEMASADLKVDFGGSGTLKLHWVARDAAGHIVDEGDTASFSADGKVSIDPDAPFFKLEVEVVAIDPSPSQNAPKFKLEGVGGKTTTSASLGDLTFEVTGKDGDGDAVRDGFTVSTKPAAPTVTLPGDPVSTLVDEAGLPARGPKPAGSDAGNDSETVTGAVEFTSSGGPTEVRLGGFLLKTTDETFSDARGTLVAHYTYLSGKGTIFYTYTLNDNTNGDNTSFKYAVLVKDAAGQQNAATELVINVVDDGPLAKSDADNVTEDSAMVADGNVLTGSGGGDENGEDGAADVQGADGATVTRVWFDKAPDTQIAGELGTALSGKYGTLTLSSDGSYVYKLNNADPLVQALSANDTRTETFTYEITDGDGDTSTTTLVITVKGANDAPDATAATTSVSEEGLAGGIADEAGSPDTGNKIVQEGTIGAVDKDGDTLTYTLGTAPTSSLTSGGQPIVWTGGGTQPLVGKVGSTPIITITLNSATGAYKVTLSGPVDHADPTIEDALSLVVPVIVSDSKEATESTLTVSIEDDKPSVSFTGASTVNEDAVGTVDGIYTFRPGADGTLSGGITLTIGGTSPYSHTISAADLADGAAVDTPIGRLVFSAPGANGAGTWTFDPGSVSATTTLNISVNLTDKDNDSHSTTSSITVNNVLQKLVVQGAVSGVVEEEHGLPGGIEDQTAASPDKDDDTTNDFGVTTNVAEGSFRDLVTGGIDGSLSFAFKSLSGNPAVTTTSSTALKSGGEPVLFAKDGDTLVGYVDKGGSGYQATDTKIFTLTLDTATGAYKFTLHAPVDHPVNSPATEDSITINLNGYVTVSDSGGPVGDTAALNASITIIDDVPLAKSDVATLDVVVDTLKIGEIKAGWTDVKLENTSNNWTSNDKDKDGVPDEIHWPDGDGSGYGFVDNPQLVNLPVNTNETFSLGTFTHYNMEISGSSASLKSATLSVTFTAIINGEPVDVGPIKINFTHTETPNSGGDSRDIIRIETTTTTVTIAGQDYTLDVRGFVSTSNLNGAPVQEIRTDEGKVNNYSLAVRFVSSDSTSVTKTGNVISDDATGADQPLQVTGVAFNTTNGTTNAAGDFQVNGKYGTLVIEKDGTYTYTLTKDASQIPWSQQANQPNPTEVFTYTVKDADGDPSSATLTIDLNKALSPANPLHGDRVITNITGTDVTISEAALLFNDEAGSQITSDASKLVGLDNVTHGGGNFVAKDSAKDGGQFTYGGTGDDSAVVTIIRRSGEELTGTAYGDILIGRSSADKINADAGDDYIVANEGDDVIDGGAGSDKILAGAGNDTIVADQADTLIDGGEGTADKLEVRSSFTSVSDDQIVGVENVVLTAGVTLDLSKQTEKFVIAGSSSADVIIGSQGVNEITGGGGNDTITGGESADKIAGGTGRDTMVGGKGADTFYLADDDFADGESIDGGEDNDEIVLTNGTTVDFSKGVIANIETLTGSSSSDTVTMTAAQWASFNRIDLAGGNSDRLNITVSGSVDVSALSVPTHVGIETVNVSGRSGNNSDTLTMTGAQFDALFATGTATLNFGSGNGNGDLADTLALTSDAAKLDGSLANDRLVGIDIITAAASAGGVTINLTNQTEAFKVIGSAQVDAITGGSGSDNIAGGGGADILSGAAGDDIISGDAGDDVITGGTGKDTMTGGAGNDEFRLANGDFASGESIAGGDDVDTIFLTNATTVDFSVGTISGVEKLVGSSGSDVVTLSGTQASGFTSIDLGGGTNTLNLVGSSINLNKADANLQGVQTISAADATSAATINLGSQLEGFKVVGSDHSDTITGGGGKDEITGGAGGDVMTGGAGNDTFNFAAGDSVLSYGGSGTNGSISGYDVITDFKPSSAESIGFSGASVASNVPVNAAAGNGTNSLYQVETGRVIGAHSILNGIVTFDDVAVGDTVTRFASAYTLTSMAQVAAAVQYLQGVDIGTTGSAVAFVATIAGVKHTFMYIQGSSNGSQNSGSNSNNNDVLIDLVGVNATSISAAGDQFSISGSTSVDPIVLDLDHNSYSFSGVENGIHFDINADGAKDQIAWNTSNDGILAYDVNGDGKIDSGSEIFTPDFNGGKFASGAAALASLDSNGDGIIDADDEAFSKLLIWQDTNGDGVGEAGELSHLSDHGISGIGTATTAPAVDTIDGQTIAGEGTVYYADGSTGNYVEVHLDAILGDGGNVDAGTASGTSGADTFVIDPSVLVSGAQMAEILTGYNAAEGDVVDLSQLLGDNVTPDTIGDFVRTVESGDGAADQLQVSTSGNASDFVTVAVLDANASVKILYNDDQHHAQNATV